MVVTGVVPPDAGASGVDTMHIKRISGHNGFGVFGVSTSPNGLVLLALLVATAIMNDVASGTPPVVVDEVAGASFQPATSIRGSLRQHRNRIRDDMWWTVTGEEMAWSHKNAHELFPTALVHRNGPVRELPRAPDQAIADYPVTTPKGAMPFDDFWSAANPPPLAS